MISKLLLHFINFFIDLSNLKILLKISLGPYPFSKQDGVRGARFSLHIITNFLKKDNLYELTMFRHWTAGILGQKL